MQKDFYEALQDGFEHLQDITDPIQLKKYREEGIRIDDEGVYLYRFGDHNEFTLCIEPMGEEGNYLVALYKTGILLTEKLPICTKRM